MERLMVKGPVSEKRRMMVEVLDTVSKDPLSVQFLRPWFWSLLPGHSPVSDRIPWMNFRAIRWLRSYLRPGMDAFEYGTGGSTVFIAPRVRSLVSIEHDPRWYEIVARALREARIANCQLRLIQSKEDPPMRDVPYGPRSYTSISPPVVGHSFEGYVRSIDEYPDRSFDLVIVDGFSRFSCVTHAIPKVRPGGYLLFDDSDWPKYREAVASLENYPRTDFVGATPFQRNLRQTSVWRL